MNFILVYVKTGCECVSYLGGHNPVITELGWDESLSGRTWPITNIDSPTVYSSLITAKLEEEAPKVEMGGDQDKKRKEREDMLVIQGTSLHLKRDNTLIQVI